MLLQLNGPDCTGYLPEIKKRQREPMQDELTEAMHGEFTIDAETDRQHRLDTARSTVRLGLFTAAKAAEAYGFSPEEVAASAWMPLLDCAYDRLAKPAFGESAPASWRFAIFVNALLTGPT